MSLLPSTFHESRSEEIPSGNSNQLGTFDQPIESLTAFLGMVMQPFLTCSTIRGWTKLNESLKSDFLMSIRTSRVFPLRLGRLIHLVPLQSP